MLVVGHWMLGVGCSMLDVLSVPSQESDGCLVALAVFKTVVGSFNGSRYVRFVPSPPAFDAWASDTSETSSPSKAGADKVVGEIAAQGGKAIAVQADVAKKPDIERLFTETKKAFGQLDEKLSRRRPLERGVSGVSSVAGVGGRLWH